MIEPNNEIGTLNYKVDRLLGPLKKGELISVLSKAANGKTAFLVSLGVNLLKQNQKIIYMTLNGMEIINKTLDIMYDEPLGTNTNQYNQLIQKFKNEYNDKMNIIEINNNSFVNFKNKIEKLLEKQKIDFLILDDYLQFGDGNFSDNHDRFSFLKETALKYNICIIISNMLYFTGFGNGMLTGKINNYLNNCDKAIKIEYNYNEQQVKIQILKNRNKNNEEDIIMLNTKRINFLPIELDYAKEIMKLIKED